MNKVILTDKTFPKIAYYKIGKGPFLTLLHGFPANADLWKNIWGPLSERYTLLIPDLPGAGVSTLNEHETSMEEMANGIKDILDNEHAAQTILVGHSMGGYVALAFASKYRERLKGLSLVHSTALPDTEEKKENRRKAINIFESGGKNRFIAQMIPGLFAEHYSEAHPEIIKEQIDTALTIPAENLAAFYKAMIDRTDTTHILKKNHLPVQFIAGKEDKLIEIHKVLAQSRLASINFVNVYNNCAHMSMLEEPGFLIHDLEEFSSYCYNH